VTVYSKPAKLPNLKANFCRLIAGKNSRAVVLKKQTDKPGTFPAKKKFSTVKFWQPPDDLQKLSVGLQKSSADLQKLSAGLQKSSVDLQKYSVE
ncbi:MAG TPA: hypothetical protein VK469_16185, partial [Candidatus Kapabacteria bacterium]|nr:hypothetical protein [Candidatus Kapabacteria bacterium]